MIDVFFTYDLRESTPDLHAAFLRNAMAHGLSFLFCSSEKIYRLPESTVWGTFDDLVSVKNAFDTALRLAKLELGVEVSVLRKRFYGQFHRSAAWVKSDQSKNLNQSYIGRRSIDTCLMHQEHDPF